MIGWTPTGWMGINASTPSRESPLPSAVDSSESSSAPDATGPGSTDGPRPTPSLAAMLALARTGRPPAVDLRKRYGPTWNWVIYTTRPPKTPIFGEHDKGVK